MNRKQKSSIILLIVALVFIPIFYKLYQITKAWESKINIVVSQSMEMLELAKENTFQQLQGKWYNTDNPDEIWHFAPDSALYLNDQKFKVNIEAQSIFIEGGTKGMLFCFFDSDSTVRLLAMKTDFIDFFDDNEEFLLQRVAED